MLLGAFTWERDFCRSGVLRPSHSRFDDGGGGATWRRVSPAGSEGSSSSPVMGQSSARAREVLVGEVAVEAVVADEEAIAGDELDVRVVDAEVREPDAAREHGLLGLVLGERAARLR
jgi:hypothetical protein